MRRVLAFAALAALMITGSAMGQGTGFNVQVYYNLPSNGPNSIAETQTDIAAHGPPDAVATPLVINYTGNGSTGDIGGDTTPPGYVGGNVDHYAITADGYVTGLSGPTAVTLGVNSDDGFGFYQNGTQIGAADTNRGPTDTTFSATLNNGDHLQLLYWENGGGDEVELWQITDPNNPGNKLLVNSGNGTVSINAAVPEPSTFALAALAGIGLVTAARRRRAA